MACRLSSAKQISEPTMTAYSSLDLWKQISVKSESQSNIFLSNMYCVSQIGSMHSISNGNTAIQ